MTADPSPRDLLSRAHASLDTRPASSFARLAGRVGASPAELADADPDGTLRARLPRTDQTDKAAAFDQDRKAGRTLAEIAAEHGITRERVRQILAANGYPTRDARVQRRSNAVAAQAAAVARIAAFLDAHPASTREQIVEATGADPAHLTAALRDPALRSRVLAPPSPAASTGLTDEQILDGMRGAAAANGGPGTGLSANRYEDLRPAGAVTAIRVLQRFGTWKQACALAGIEPGRSGRTSYTRRWTEQEMLAHVRAYFASPGCTGSYAGYEEWARSESSAPSAQTVRNSLGPWAQVKARALAG